MRSTILLLCCLALLNVSAAQNYARVYAGASMLERAHFHSLVATLLTENETYKPKETGDINFQCMQILVEVFSMLPETNSRYIPQYITDTLPVYIDSFMWESVGFSEEKVVGKLKVALDKDYDRMMEKIEQRADRYRKSLAASNKNAPNLSLQYLASFYERLSKLKEENKGRKLIDTIRSVFHLYRGLPRLSDLRPETCIKEEAFDFTRETLTRNFERFLGLLQHETAEHLVTDTEYPKNARDFLSYFEGVLDEKIMKALYSVHADTELSKAMMQLTLAVVFRLKAYFMTLDDIKFYDVEKYFELPQKVMEGLKLSHKMALKFNDAAVPGILRALKEPYEIDLTCEKATKIIANNVNMKEGFKLAAKRFCTSQSNVIRLFVRYALAFGQKVHAMQTYNGLPNIAAFITNSMLHEGQLYPDSHQNPAEGHPSLLKKSQWTMKIALLDKLKTKPKYLPKSFVSGMMAFINVTTGTPVFP